MRASQVWECARLHAQPKREQLVRLRAVLVLASLLAGHRHHQGAILSTDHPPSKPLPQAWGPESLL